MFTDPVSRPVIGGESSDDQKRLADFVLHGPYARSGAPISKVAARLAHGWKACQVRDTVGGNSRTRHDDPGSPGLHAIARVARGPVVMITRNRLGRPANARKPPARYGR